MTAASEFPSYQSIVSAVISSGQNASAAVDLVGTTLVGIQLPATFTGTSLTFQMATSAGGTYQTMIDGSGTTLTKTIVQGRYLLLDPAEFAGVQFLKVLSGATEGAARTLELVTRPV